jgi:hypothetical protein
MVRLDFCVSITSRLTRGKSLWTRIFLIFIDSVLDKNVADFGVKNFGYDCGGCDVVLPSDVHLSFRAHHDLNSCAGKHLNLNYEKRHPTRVFSTESNSFQLGKSPPTLSSTTKFYVFTAVISGNAAYAHLLPSIFQFSTTNGAVPGSFP